VSHERPDAERHEFAERSKRQESPRSPAGPGGGERPRGRARVSYDGHTNAIRPCEVHPPLSEWPMRNLLTHTCPACGRTELAMRGDGQSDPIRRLIQFWSLDGELLAEVDSCARQEAAVPTARIGAKTGALSPLVPTVVRIVAARYGVTPADIMGDSRAQPTVSARQLAMRLVRDLGNLSYPEIGRAFGKDHTAVMHACQQTEGLAVGDVIEDINEALRSDA